MHLSYSIVKGSNQRLDGVTSIRDIHIHRVLQTIQMKLIKVPILALKSTFLGQNRLK